MLDNHLCNTVSFINTVSFQFPSLSKAMPNDSKPPVETPYLRPDEAAEYAKLSHTTLSRYRRAGKLPYYATRDGSTKHIYHKDDLEDLLQGMRRDNRLLPHPDTPKEPSAINPLTFNANPDQD